VDRPGQPEFFPLASLPVLIHGDASFPAQGVVAETLNLSRLEGYAVAGAIHIIANNQLGYTTDPEEGRSTLYASDLAKGFEIPVIHVNADDPEACLEAARIAFTYRHKFQKDFVIDLIGYRRYGHNEGDEPTFTQPLMYDRIREHPGVRKRWGQVLVDRGLMEADTIETRFQAHMNELQAVLESVEVERVKLEPELQAPPAGEALRVKTGVSLEKLRKLNNELLRLPEGFRPNRKIERAMSRRGQVLAKPDENSIDWATAEELALASILADGTPIRLTGEDVARGTFSQRHAVFHDVENGQTFTPLQTLPLARASFEVVNTPLSESAAIGFELGYNIQAPDRLVLWEAQYGDFINVAQAIIDEFLVSGRAKWEQTPSLVLLLPHGYEGQGPDHSSARLERFLQLAAQTNLRIANCTTAAQYFHLLRRQAALLKSDPLPLIVMTPKSLLRHPLVASAPRELVEGRWRPVIEDQQARSEPNRVRRIVLCSGKIYVDLVSSPIYGQNGKVAIVRLEQLYPFPAVEIDEIIRNYPELQEAAWVQEEPKNMGAWSFLQPRLQEILPEHVPLHYIGRIQNSSPAEGSSAWHTVNQQAIVQNALDLESNAANKQPDIEEELVESGGLVERD
jgi:2-oxoglutarate dehydrogenase E1 component